MPTAYHRDQAGAPALVYNSNSLSTAHFDAFRDILKACLINGYGSIPAAGWTLIHDASNSIILRNASASGYVCFQRVTNTCAVVWVTSTYSGVDANGKIIGDGLKTNYAANNTALHLWNLQALVSYSASSSWAMVADADTFIFSGSGWGTPTPTTLLGNQGLTYYANSTLYCGNDSGGDFIVVGGGTSATANDYGTSAYFNHTCFTMLKYPDTGELVDTGSSYARMFGIADNTIPSQGYAWTSEQGGQGTQVPSLFLTPMCWASRGVFRSFRGLLVDYRLVSTDQTTFSRLTGGPDLTTRNIFNNPVDLGDAYTYFIARVYYIYAPQFVITDNPGFW